MRVYVPGGFEDDFALLAWWLKMGETGDLEKVFTKAAWPLTSFVAGFAPPTTLWYEADEQGWTAAAWIWPLMSGATYSLWLREDKRKSRESYEFIHETVRTALSTYPVLLYVTRAEAVVRQGKSLGFIPCGELPYLWDGDSAYLGVATPFTYEAATNKETPNGRENA